MLCVIGILFITGFKYFSVESYRYRTSFTADADYRRYDEELEKRKLEEYLDAVKRNKDVKKEKNDQLKDFDRIRAEQGIEKVKDQKLHRQKTNQSNTNVKKYINDEAEEEDEVDVYNRKNLKKESRDEQRDREDDIEENEDEDFVNKENHRGKHRSSSYRGHRQKEW